VKDYIANRPENFQAVESPQIKGCLVGFTLQRLKPLRLQFEHARI